jgi:hypothetical protein
VWAPSRVFDFLFRFRPKSAALGASLFVSMELSYFDSDAFAVNKSNNIGPIPSF